MILQKSHIRAEVAPCRRVRGCFFQEYAYNIALFTQACINSEFIYKDLWPKVWVLRRFELHLGEILVLDFPEVLGHLGFPYSPCLENLFFFHRPVWVIIKILYKPLMHMSERNHYGILLILYFAFSFGLLFLNLNYSSRQKCFFRKFIIDYF